MSNDTEKDIEHLKVLSIFYYVFAGLVFILSALYLIHIIVGIIVVAAPEFLPEEAVEPFPPFFGWIFVIIGAGCVLLGWAMSVCLILAGRFLQKKRHYLFCLVMALLISMFVPFGTVLGVFTIIVLNRTSVRELFNRPA